MESSEHRYTLCPARFIFGIILSFCLMAGIIFSVVHFGWNHSMILILGMAAVLLVLTLIIVFVSFRLLHKQDLLVINPEGLQVNFTGLGRLVPISWDNVLYTKYYAYSIDQYALGIALKDPESWMKSISIPEKLLAKTASLMGKTIINIQQNTVREPLSEAAAYMKHYIVFDDEMIFKIEHPEKQEKNFKNLIS